MANVGAGLIQGIPVSTSLSASSASDNAGARSPVASLSTGGVVILTLLILAPVFSDLPKPVLAAVIIDAVVMGMIDIPEMMRRLFHVRRSTSGSPSRRSSASSTFGVLAGIVIGAVLSVGWLVYVSTRPGMPVLGRIPGSHVFREHESHPDDELFPGIVAVRPRRRSLLRRPRTRSRPHPRALAGRITPRWTGDRARLRRHPVRSTPRDPPSSGRSPILHVRTASTVRLARVRPAVLEVLIRDRRRRTESAPSTSTTTLNQAVEAQMKRWLCRPPIAAGRRSRA